VFKEGVQPRSRQSGLRDCSGPVRLANRARLGKPHWYVVGEKGALLKEGVDPQEACMLRGDIRASQEDPANYARVATEIAGTVVELRLQTLRGDWTAYYRNIADALTEGAELAVRPEEARRGVILLQAIEESIRTGRTVEFAEGL